MSDKHNGERLERVASVVSMLDQVTMKLCEIIDEQAGNPRDYLLTGNMLSPAGYVPVPEMEERTKRKRVFQQSVRFQIAQLFSELHMTDEFYYMIGQIDRHTE